SERVIGYVDALREALHYKMENDKSVFMLGQGVDDPGGMFGVTRNFHEVYGRTRSFDTPVSEEGVMGICTGAAMNGMRPVYFHNRPDFLLLTFNQIVNHASKMHWMDNGTTNVPMTVWAAIGRGWGSGPQHSQAIQGLMLSVPGIKIIMPSTPYDAKGLMISAIEDNNPTFIFEHRWLTRREGSVPEEAYRVPIGKGIHRREGKALTIVGTSHAIDLAWTAAKELAADSGIDAEVIDLRTLKPLDEEIILESVAKTGKLLVVDTGWAMGGVCAEIGCLVAEKAFNHLKAPVMRVGLPDCPSPAGYTLEQLYYPDVNTMKKAIIELHNK
ncbi:MAG TPA: transketolase C-terminal domain-containing protein, partial [Candidatus Saccharibacteria bacterium]|nr:transketolase C-terminal domain-containing protein [Candidatus Saccharibacteria bacterium]